MLILAGIVYASVFLIVAYSYPRIALFAVFVCSPFPNDLSGDSAVKFSFAEINLILALPVVFMRGKRMLGGFVIGATTIYLAACFLCSLLNWRATTLVSMVQMIIYLVIVVLVFASLAKNQEDYRLCFDGFIVGTTFLAAAVVIARSPYVLGIHKNNCGQAIAAGLLVSLEMCFHEKNLKKKIFHYGMLMVQAGGLIMCLSRGSWLGAAVGTFIIFAMRRQFFLMLRATLLLAVLAAVCWHLLPAESKTYATGLGSENYNINARYISKDIAMNQFRNSPLIGVGVGFRKEYDATNLVFMILAETGVVGILSFTLMEALVMIYLWQTQSKLPRSSFSFSIVAIAGALVMAKLAHGMVDHYWVRGTLMAGWGSIGMVAKVAYDKKVQRRQLLKARRERRSAMLQPSAEAPLEMVDAIPMPR